VRTLTLNDLEIRVHRKKHPYDEEKVVILDSYEDVLPLEAELIVRYLYAEGFINSDEPSLEIIRNRYGIYTNLSKI
jgi:hypothetical protein